VTSVGGYIPTTGTTGCE